MKISIKYLLSFIFLVILSTSLFSQKNTIDSLTKVLEKTNNDTLKINVMLRISSEYKGYNNDLAIKYAKEAYSIAKSLNASVSVIEALIHIGNSYYYKSDYEKAVTYYIQALAEYEKSNENSGMASVMNNIGVVYYAWGQHNKALNYYKKSFELYEKLNDSLGISKITNNIGNLFFEKKLLDSALVYYQKSIKLKQELKDYTGEALLLNNIGNVYAVKRDYKVARKYFLSSLKIYQEHEEDYGVALSLINISNLFKEEQLTDSAFFYIQKALELSDTIDASDLKLDCYEMLTSLYEDIGNYKEAFKYYQLYVETKEKIKSQETESAIEELNLKYQTEKKEQQIALQETQLAKERLLRNGLIILVLLFIALAILILKAYRDKQKTSLKLAEQNKTIEHQKMIVEEKQKALLDSIHYAQRIQQALLTSEIYIEKVLKRLKN